VEYSADAYLEIWHVGTRHTFFVIVPRQAWTKMKHEGLGVFTSSEHALENWLVPSKTGWSGKVIRHALPNLESQSLSNRTRARCEVQLV
jgi:hypothetical protein